jgi:hypothetical protein
MAKLVFGMNQSLDGYVDQRIGNLRRPLIFAEMRGMGLMLPTA